MRVRLEKTLPHGQLEGHTVLVVEPLGRRSGQAARLRHPSAGDREANCHRIGHKGVLSGECAGGRAPRASAMGLQRGLPSEHCTPRA